MSEKLIGQRITRTEDPQLLTGQALFVDDVQIPVDEQLIVELCSR